MNGHPSRIAALPLVRRLVCVIVTVALAGSCSRKITDPTQLQFEILITALALSGGLGTDMDLIAAVTGGSPGGNLDAITWTVTPSSLGTITSTGRNAKFRGLNVGLATITARHESGASDDVELTVQPPTLAFIGTYNYGGTTPEPATDLKRGVRLRYQIGNLTDLSLVKLEYAVDTGAYAGCEAPSGGFFDCLLKTSLVTNGQAAYLNGPHVINSRIVINVGGATATTGAPQSVTFNNQPFLDYRINHPTGMTGTLWRGSDLTLTGTPIRFDGGPVANYRFGVDVTRVSGSGNVVFNQTSPIGTPFTYTLNSQTTAEGVFSFTPRMYDLNGVDLGSSFGVMPAPITTGLNVVAPRISASPLPSVMALNVLSVRLKYQTGPYAANTLIPMSRIVNGLDVPAHAPFCSYRHLHGNISIRNADGTANSALYVDPDPPDPCGHGEILTAPLSEVTLQAFGVVTEPWLGSLNLRLYRAVGSCDLGPAIVDDVPIAQGTAPGESPNPVYTMTTGGTTFNNNFRYNTDGSMVNTMVCIRGEAVDRTINAAGQPSPNTRVFGFQTRFTF